ncbi:MAG: DinB family protein [Cyclobacteriaceae bacterium]|nr:DinB family protein [Cyclobacteriaceae bacterium]
MANKEIQQLVMQFRSIYDGEPWYGNPMQEILKDVPAEAAFWAPKKNAHSIAQLVWHMVYWRQSLIKRLAGDTAYKGSVKSEDNWSTEAKLKALGWPAIRELLHASQKQLIELLEKQTDKLLDEPYSEKATYRDLITGIIQHDLYHLGQVAYLKSISKMQKGET